jgi:dUTP pyrophosphatase
MILLPYIEMDFYEVDNLSETERGEGGFGSTGKV